MFPVTISTSGDTPVIVCFCEIANRHFVVDLISLAGAFEGGMFSIANDLDRPLLTVQKQGTV